MNSFKVALSFLVFYSFYQMAFANFETKNKGKIVKSIGVIGEGAWGTAIASLLAENGYQVHLWCYDKVVAQGINQEHQNSHYMPDFVLSPRIIAYTDLKDVMFNEWIFISTPIKFFRDIVTQCKPYYRRNQRWVVLSKGIENDTLMLPSQILAHVLSSQINVAVLGGPSFAHGVMDRCTTGVNIAASDSIIAEDLALLVRNAWFRPFINDDVLGIELGGALKNVVAILLGISTGMQNDDNTHALLFTRAWQEMTALAEALGAKHKTLQDLAGIGDLFLTVSGHYSRNFFVGKRLGSGQKLESVLQETGFIPEGLNTVKTVKQLIEKYQLTLPLFSTLYAVVFENFSPTQLTDVAVHAEDV